MSTKLKPCLGRDADGDLEHARVFARVFASRHNFKTDEAQDLDDLEFFGVAWEGLAYARSLPEDHWESELHLFRGITLAMQNSCRKELNRLRGIRKDGGANPGCWNQVKLGDWDEPSWLDEPAADTAPDSVLEVMRDLSPESYEALRKTFDGTTRGNERFPRKDRNRAYRAIKKMKEAV